MGAPQVRLQGDGFAKELDAFLIAAIQDEDTASGFVCRAIVRVPGRVWLVVQPVDGGEDGFGLDGIRRHIEGFVGLRAALAGSLSSSARRASSSCASNRCGSASSACCAKYDSLRFVAVRRYQGQAQQSVGLLGLDFQGFVEELGGVGGLKSFQKQSAPADAIFGVARMRRHQRAKNIVRFDIAVLFPERFGLGESGTPQSAPGGPAAAQRMASSSLTCRSPPECVPAPARARPSCFLYSSGGMAAFSYLSLSICCSNSSFLASSWSLAGSFAAVAVAPIRSRGN